MKQRELYLSPTLLDAFVNYLDCESSWQKYYGDSEDPKITLSDYEQLKYEELIAYINREKGEPIEAASRGTAFNDLVDTLAQGRVMGRTKFSRVYDNPDATDRHVVAVRSEIDGFTFDFEYGFVKSVADKFKDATPQVLVSADIETKYGLVNLYGYIDELMLDTVYDLKTTSRYEFGKYKNYNQRYVYPYCLIESGMMTDVREFEFSAYKLSTPSQYNPFISGTYNREVYTYDHEDAKKHIRQVVENFYEFVQNHRDEIKDDRIFVEHSHNH